MAFNMSKAEREAFLGEAHIGVLAIPDRGSGPLTSPVWYDYEAGGDLWFLTQSTARKGRLLAEGGRVSLLVQTSTSPYKYVSIEGPVSSIVPSDLLADLQPMAQRYLGEQAGKDYAAGSAENYAKGNSIKVFIRPERWLTVDYAKRP
ncbi:MAG: pyridoxamine 5'-phosphate oxidase family protein [Alphaproteobacteria bacterium]|nr:pyridoxamine 5'-phosphate oxidase family protein [Alphaproteobacteria bacterium]MDP6832475.1 pyridoxamine 5'-phosphate oxidase family protein [Alphaproteobacteria bacterium]MDP6873393.1 pyridoxamine 5'-phosphate oxidase family protein [Alphaproteobacteria bacterium]